MPGSRPCQPSSGCSASGVGRRDVGFLAFAVGEDAGLWFDALGVHVRGRLDDRQQLRHLPGDTLRGLLVQPLLFGGSGLQLLGRLGEHPGFLFGVEGVALRFPLQVDAGLVVLDVAGRVAIQVADIEARPGFLAVLLAFDADAVLVACLLYTSDAADE